VDLDPRSLVALDWSFKKVHVTFDGVEVVCLRSEVHHHSFRFARRRGVTWKLYRRELPRVFSRLKSARPARGS